MASANPSTVLVVDDEQAILDYLSEVLRLEGYECRCFSGSLAALAYITEGKEPADLLLADISMPDVGGIELLREVKSRFPSLPVILISGLYELALAVDALQAGADDYLKKPVTPSDVAALVGKYLAAPTGRQEKEIQESLREFLVSRPGDPKASEQFKQLFRKLGFKRYETFEHSARVASYCRLFGQCRGLDEEALRPLELGALLHDIGKIGIPRNILLKPGSLTEEEWEVMRVHPGIGYRLMSEFPELSEEAEIVYSHHERYDRTGYPRGLGGEEIPLGARLFSIVDAFDAITSDRPYRAARSIAAARAEIEKGSGSQFDPQLVRTFSSIPDAELEKIRNRFPNKQE